MAERFYGEWMVEVIQTDPALSQRFITSGSSNDNVYPAETTTNPVSVSSWPRQGFEVQMEWKDIAGSDFDWHPSDVRRIGVDYTLQDGLVVLLKAEDNDFVLRCRNVDPQLNPWRSSAVNLPDFTLPEDVRRPADNGDDDRDDRERDDRERDDRERDDRERDDRERDDRERDDRERDDRPRPRPRP
jgi:hypothetical protein